MAFLDHINACNQHDPKRYVPFIVDEQVVGKVTHGFAQRVSELSGQVRLIEKGLVYRAPAGSLKERSQEFSELLHLLRDEGVISHLHGEQYVATPSMREQGILLIDRAAAPYFGIRAFGQHLNGYVRHTDGMMMWLGRRAADRKHYPGHLDNLAAGGLPYDISFSDNLRKECWEEAGIPADLADQAKPVGTVTYCADTEKGCKPDTLYCYDLELPEAFQPTCTDGEVDEFILMPVKEVMNVVRNTNEFKLNCNLVVIDFLIRHGFIGPDEPDYLKLSYRLHYNLDIF